LEESPRLVNWAFLPLFGVMRLNFGKKSLGHEKKEGFKDGKRV